MVGNDTDVFASGPSSSRNSARIDRMISGMNRGLPSWRYRLIASACGRVDGSLMPGQCLTASGRQVHRKRGGNRCEILQRSETANNPKRPKHPVGKLTFYRDVLCGAGHSCLLHRLRSQDHGFYFGFGRVGPGLGVGFQLGDFGRAASTRSYLLAERTTAGMGTRRFGDIFAADVVLHDLPARVASTCWPSHVKNSEVTQEVSVRSERARTAAVIRVNESRIRRLHQAAHRAQRARCHSARPNHEMSPSAQVASSCDVGSAMSRDFRSSVNSSAPLVRC